MPEGQLGDVRGQPGGGAVIIQGFGDAPGAQVGIPGVHVLVGLMQGDHAAQLGHRLRVIFHAQLHHTVHPGAAGRMRLDDEDSGGLLPANIPACVLGGLQSGQQTIGQVPAGGAVGGGHSRPHGGMGHHISLRRKALAGFVPGGRDAAGAGVGSHAPLRIHHRHLAHIAAFIRG